MRQDGWRRRAAGCALAIATVGVGVSGPLPEASGAVAARVGAADVPTLAQAIRQYPQYRGGERSVGRTYTLSKIGRDCVGYVNASRQPRSGRIASYTLRDGTMAYFEGMADPSALVYQFRSVEKASNALAEQRRSITRCEGRHVDSAGYGKAFARVATPRLGASRFAYRLKQFDAYTGVDYEIDTWVRKGRYLLNVMVQKDPSAPSAKPAFAFTRTAVAVAGSTTRTSRVPSPGVARDVVSASDPSSEVGVRSSSARKVRTVTFRGPGARIRRHSGDLDKLSRTSPGFRRAVERHLDRMWAAYGEPAGCETAPTYWVKRWRSDGWARIDNAGMFSGPSSCSRGGNWEIWKRRLNGRWVTALGGQDYATCRLLRRTGVPVGMVPGGKCWEGSSVVRYDGPRS